jgi:hypothetical protein
MRVTCLGIGLSLLVACQAAGQTFNCVDVANPAFPAKPTQVCTLHEPNVTQPVTDHTEVRFTLKDEVTVEAGGCVQTGGHGRTWKRYVDPSGDNSDRLYFGTIDIPYITAGLEPIRNIVGHTRVIQDLPHHGVDPCDLFLKLGYKDDHYEDNGYYAHDDGTQNQCAGVENAWVRITIKHHNPADDIPDEKPAAPMDLWWNTIDDNLLPLNPGWGLQIVQNQIPNAGQLCNSFHDEGDHLQLNGCTTWRPEVDEPSFSSNPFYYSVCHAPIPGNIHDGVHGHINWGYGTHTGKLYFEDFQGSIGEDHDYDLWLVSDGEEGVTSGNDHSVGGKVALGMEFNADESIEHMGDAWWKNLASTVSLDGITSGDWPRTRSLLDGKDAIVIGEIGIDNQHGAKAELHPIFALAVHIKNDPCDDTWAVFARNWGNEGSCSQEIHTIAKDNLEFFFPNLGAESYTINDSLSSFDRVLSSRFLRLNDRSLNGTSRPLADEVLNRRYDPQSIGDYWGAKVFDDGVVLNLFMTSPENRSIVNGQLHLKRSSCPGTAPSSMTQITPPQIPSDRARLATMNPGAEPDSDTLSLLTFLTKEQRKRYYRKFIHIARFQPNSVYSVKMRRKDETVELHHRVLKPQEVRAPMELTAEQDVFAFEDRRQQYEALLFATGGEDKLMAVLNTEALAQRRPETTRKDVVEEYRQFIKEYNAWYNRFWRWITFDP